MSSFHEILALQWQKEQLLKFLGWQCWLTKSQIWGNLGVWAALEDVCALWVLLFIYLFIYLDKYIWLAYDLLHNPNIWARSDFTEDMMVLISTATTNFIVHHLRLYTWLPRDFSWFSARRNSWNMK